MRGLCLLPILGLTMACGGSDEPSTPVPPVTPSCSSAPSVPSNLRSPAQTATSVTLAWDPVPAGAGCTVSYRVFQDGSPSAVASPATNSATLTGLAPHTQHAFTVAAVNAAGASAQGPALQVLTAGTPPSQIQWKGHTWRVKSGTGMGPGPNAWDRANVFLDGQDRLHLKISQKDGAWSCAEVYTAPDTLGFGTYQWQVEGRIDAFDPNIVLGLFTYGPSVGAGTDGTNEIDVEFAHWGNASYPIGNWTVWPASAGSATSETFTFSLPSARSTSRFTWSDSSVAYRLMEGFQSLDSTAGDLHDPWTFQPPTPQTSVPQLPASLNMNLWLFKGQAPTDGQEVEIILQDFQFVPLG